MFSYIQQFKQPMLYFIIILLTSVLIGTIVYFNKKIQQIKDRYNKTFTNISSSIRNFKDLDDTTSKTINDMLIKIWIDNAEQSGNPNDLKCLNDVIKQCEEAEQWNLNNSPPQKPKEINKDSATENEVKAYENDITNYNNNLENWKNSSEFANWNYGNKTNNSYINENGLSTYQAPCVNEQKAFQCNMY